MTDQKEPSEPSEAQQAPAESEEANETASPQEARDHDDAASEAGSPGRGNAIAWIALLFALAGLGGSGWIIWQEFEQRGKDPTGARIEQLASDLGSQTDRLQRQSSRSDNQAARIDELQNRIDALGSRLESVSREAQDDESPVDLEPLRESIESQANATEQLSADLAALSERVDSATEGLEGRMSSIESQVNATESLSDDIDALGERVDTAVERLQGRMASIESQASATERLAGNVDALSERLDTTIERLEARIETLQARRDDRLAESLSRAEYRLGLIEIAGLLRMARASARSEGDPAAVISAYEQAIERANALDAGRSEDLRQALAAEVEALRGVESTDWAELVGRLAALETQSSNWPLAGRQVSGEPDRPGTAGSAEASSESESSGLWSGVRRSLGGLVRVTPRAAAPLNPAAAESVRERVRLHLAGAQAAATRRQPAEMMPHLSAVESLLEAHFEATAPGVRRARTALTDAAEARVADWPDLGGALSEVEQQLGES